jgi:hypothetical protein
MDSRVNTTSAGEQKAASPLLTWGFLVVISVLIAAKASTLYPASNLEKLVAIWPPSQPLADYLSRLLVHPLFRWDALYHFQTIVAEGYSPGNGSLAFFPLYPLLARSLTFIGFDPFIALLAVSWLSGLGFILVFERLARLDNPQEASLATSLLLIFPIAMVLFIPYTESLFLFCAALCLYFARQERWWLAGLAGMFATLTKQPGIFLILPLGIELWTAGKGKRRFSGKELGHWLSVGLIPLAMISWIMFRTLVIEKAVPDTRNFQDLVLSLLVSSNPGDMVIARQFVWPWQVTLEALTTAYTSPQVRFNVYINLGGYFLIVLLLIGRWKAMRPSYQAFSLCLVAFSLLDFSFNLCAIPIPSLFRHAYLAFPVFIGIPTFINRKWTRLLYITLCFLLFMLLIYAYGLEGWVV